MCVTEVINIEAKSLSLQELMKLGLGFSLFPFIPGIDKLDHITFVDPLMSYNIM